MKRKQFSDEQIIGILKEAEAGAVVTDLCRRHGMSSATFYAWKGKFGGMEVSDAKRLRALEDENGKLKRLLADAMLDNAGLKDLLAKMYDLPCLSKGLGRSDEGSPPKCNRPPASGPLLRPGHDEIRTRRSQISGSCRGTYFLTGLTTRRSTVSSSLSSSLAVCEPVVRRRPDPVGRRARRAEPGWPKSSARSCWPGRW